LPSNREAATGRRRRDVRGSSREMKSRERTRSWRAFAEELDIRSLAGRRRGWSRAGGWREAQRGSGGREPWNKWNKWNEWNEWNSGPRDLMGARAASACRDDCHCARHCKAGRQGNPLSCSPATGSNCDNYTV
jgi:hypothetical protein